ncbi:hypothetical protein [Streptomyces sp. LN704]
MAKDRSAYKQPTTVARRIDRLHQGRDLASRYDKTATIHLAAVHIAAMF